MLAWDIDLVGAAEVFQLDGSTGQVASLPVGDFLVFLVGVGVQTATDFRRAGAALARATTDRRRVATTIPAIADTAGFEAFVVGMILGSFGFHWRSAAAEATPVGHVVLAGLPDANARAAELTRARATGMAGWRARFLATVPSNLKSPEWLAQQARDIAADSDLDVRIWDDRELADEGFGGIVGVGQASASPPRMIRLDYTPRSSSPSSGGRKQKATAARVVLVGKGITFDTGGLSIKSGEAMRTMKRDMTGGAVVLATMAALGVVDCPVRVTGLIAVAENAVSGHALRPGDVLRHYGGRTTEVTNTDAEGRLVLADALAYAVAEIAPDAIVDIATLTGAMKVALGQRTGGYFANHDGLAKQIHSAGEAAGEPLWRLPLVADYADKLSSKVADADNAPGGPGAITAALFLQHFVGDVPWAHLDIASAGDSPCEHHEWTTGPTGFGARTLLAWLGQGSPLEGIV
jgi:leucyl aminopeptidase